MTGFWVLFRKEVLEQRRTWKFLALVAVFAGLALLTAVIPFIVAVVNDEPRDYQMARDMLLGYGITTVLLGSLLAILTSMGSLAGERASGTAAMTLSKPVTRLAFVGAKFLGMVVSIYSALAVGAALMYVLTLILIHDGGLGEFAPYMAIIGVYLVFVASLTFFWSGMFAQQLLAGGLAFLLLVLQIPLSTIPDTGRYWPFKTVGWAASFIGEGDASESELWPAFAVSCGLIAVLSIGAWAVFRRKEL